MGGAMTSFRIGVCAGLLLVAVTAGSLLAYAADRGKVSGIWFSYSGTLDDRALPTSKDAKVWMEISGPQAAEMYRRLGASVQENNVCGDSDMENRRRGEVDCTRTKSSGAVTCHINFDLRTGKVWGGTIC